MEKKCMNSNLQSIIRNYIFDCNIYLHVIFVKFLKCIFFYFFAFYNVSDMFTNIIRYFCYIRLYNRILYYAIYIHIYIF